MNYNYYLQISNETLLEILDSYNEYVNTKQKIKIIHMKGWEEESNSIMLLLELYYQ